MTEMPNGAGEHGAAWTEQVDVSRAAIGAAALGLLGLAGYLLQQRRRRPRTVGERIREVLKGQRPVDFEELGETARRSASRGRELATGIIEQAAPQVEATAEALKDIGQDVARRFQRETLPWARQVGKAYAPRAQEVLERSREVGKDIAGRVQEEIIPSAAATLEETRERLMGRQRKPLKPVRGFVRSVRHAITSTITYLLIVAGAAALVIFIFAPERAQREALFRRVGEFASGVGEFISDVRESFVETSETGS